jgi:hypothetical protein
LILQANFGAQDQGQWRSAIARTNPHWTSPGAEIDARARAAAGAQPLGHFGETNSIFSNEISGPEIPPQILAGRQRAGVAFLVPEEGSD